MAGIVVPTFMLLVIMTVFTSVRHFSRIPVPIERVIVFPMAVVPNLWGLWNVLYLSLGLRGRMSLGIFGAILPFLLAPAGLLLASAMGLWQFVSVYFVFAFPVVLIIYYIIWEEVVKFFNQVLEIA